MDPRSPLTVQVPLLDPLKGTSSAQELESAASDGPGLRSKAREESGRERSHSRSGDGLSVGAAELEELPLPRRLRGEDGSIWEGNSGPADHPAQVAWERKEGGGTESSLGEWRLLWMR